MRIFQKYSVRNLNNGNYIVVRPRYNYVNEMRVVSDEFITHDLAYEHAESLNFKIVKEKRKTIIKV
jgi:hypothetical protein